MESAVIITPIVTLLTLAIGLIWQGYQAARDRRWAMEDRQLLVKTHELVNSAMSLQKQALATTSAALARVTKDPADVAAAQVALADYLAHAKTLPQAAINGGGHPLPAV